MLIDLVDKESDFSLMYESDVIPAVGNTLTLYEGFGSGEQAVAPFEALITHVNHLLVPPIRPGDYTRDKLITCSIMILTKRSKT